MKRTFSFLMLALLSGCGSDARPMPDKSEIAGRILLKGKPLQDAKVVLQPLGVGSDAHGVCDRQGNFKLQAVPGRYTWFVSPKDEKRISEAAVKSVPEAYRSGSLDRVIEAGQSQLELFIQ